MISTLPTEKYYNGTQKYVGTPTIIDFVFTSHACQKNMQVEQTLNSQRRKVGAHVWS